MQYLSRQDGYTRTLTKKKWWELLGITNHKYGRMTEKELLQLDKILTSFEIRHFYQRCNKKLEQILFSSLNNLKNRKLINYQIQTVIVTTDEETGKDKYFLATDDNLKSINDLITEDMMIDKDTGNLTEMGALSITMNSQQLDTELNNLQTYVKKRQQIMDDFANGSSKSKYGEKTYDELMSENDSAMQESLKNVNNYRQSIISIVTNQAKAVQDAMFKEIDARKKALKKKKEYYDYDKTIKKKTDEIELIKQQIRGLEGLTDAESKAQKARLEASLKDKQDDLDDTVRDHVYDITVNGLDDLETQLSEDFEKWSNQLSSDLAKMSDAISNTISGAGENYSDMMAGIDYILNNIGGITSGQYFTSQDKSNMKKSNSFDTGYNSGHLKGYAKGTKHVGGVPRVAMTNENGREIIVTKKGILTPVEPSDGIIPNDMTETLMKMAERQQNYAMNSNFKMPELKVKDASGNSVNNVYNTFTVQGDLTRDTLPELNKILDLASSKTQNDIRKNKRRFG